MASLTSEDTQAESATPESFVYVEERCTELYRLRDTYFPPSADEKDAKLKPIVDDIVRNVDGFEDNTVKKRGWKARAAYLKGKALSVFETYNAEAESNLSKSVKLDPSNMDAWNCLAECFWKNSDLLTAQTCLEGALKIKHEQSTLCLYSMLLRQIKPDSTTMVKNVKASIATAKEAVSLGLSNAHAWYVLGNAYLGSFFNLAHEQADLKRALSAYGNAEKHRDENVNLLPDLYYNRAEVHSYLQNYSLAIMDYRRAGMIDPVGLSAEEKIAQIYRNIFKTSELASKKCGVKAKRLEGLVKTMLASEFHKAVVATSEKQEKENLRSKFVGLSGLRVGENPGTVVPLTYLIPSTVEVTPSLIMFADMEQECVCVALYHVGQDRLDFFNSKHVYHVIDPVLKMIELKNEQTGKVTSIPCIQVEHPNRLLRDGNLLSSFYTHESMRMTNRG